MQTTSQDRPQQRSAVTAGNGPGSVGPPTGGKYLPQQQFQDERWGGGREGGRGRVGEVEGGRREGGGREGGLKGNIQMIR